MVITRSKTKKMKQASDHQSGALIGSSEDLLTEIFLRLPVTSIVRFKSVSKHWRGLLSDRHFTHRYDKLSKSPGILAGNGNGDGDGDVYVPFDVENQSPPPFRSLEFYFNRRGAKILQSCNGLLLCRTDAGHPFLRGAFKYYVFNPTTKQLAIIPNVPGGQKVLNTICFMGLAFHQTDCIHYKLVCIRDLKPYRRDLFQIQTYSSDTRKWKISIKSFSSPTSLDFRNPVYWNGAVHWAPFYGNYLYFKIDDEQLQTLPLPEGLMSSQVSTMYFGESRGHLHLILHTDREENSLRLNVYEMLRDHSGWVAKYQLELDELPGAFLEMFNMRRREELKVIDVVRGEQEEDTFVVLKIYEKIITYNVHDKTFKQIFTLHFNPPGYYCDIFPCFHRYTGTLTSF